MRKPKNVVYSHGVGSCDRYATTKVVSRRKVVRKDLLKGIVMSTNGRNPCLKTTKKTIHPLAYPFEKQRWLIKDIGLENSGNSKGKILSKTDLGKWNVKEINLVEQSTVSGALLDSKKSKAKRSSKSLGVDGQNCAGFDYGIENDGELMGHGKPSVECNSDHAEFHHLSGKRYLLILRYPSRLHFRGALSVTPIIGSTSFLGYEFFPGVKSRLVFSPKGTSPLYLQALGYMNGGDFESMPKLPGLDHNILRRIGLRDSAILIEPASGDQWDKLFGCFVETLNFNPLIPSTIDTNHKPSELNVELNLGVEFVQPGESVVSSRLHEENYEWDRLSEAVLNAGAGEGPIRLMVFGGKGVGKSTFMRFMVNQWFSSSIRRKKSGHYDFRERRALFVDFDPGQSEFVPPGCISATVISDPLLGPNYTHLKDPERMICIGDLNVERCPDWYLKCADELLKFCYSNPALCQLPWFINTMGFCRGIGGDLAVKLIQLCHPTHVIQISSRFSRRNFEPLDLLSWCSVNSWNGMDWNPSISSHQGPKLSEYAYYQLRSLAERSSAEEVVLNGVQGATENGSRALEDSGELEDVDSEWGLPAWQSRDLCIIAYFSRIVTEPRYSILQSTPEMIKLSDLILSLPSPLLEPEMITTAFNARLVALCNIEESRENIIGAQNHQLEEGLGEIPDTSITKREKLPWGRVLKPNTSWHPKVLFHMPVAPCLGFGIVRAIDKNNHSLFLTTPVKDEVMLCVNCLATSPSLGSLPKEIYFEPLRLNPKRRDRIPYTVICDKNSILSRTIPRVFQIPTKCLPSNKA
ncbi:polynucleotide 5'-hydroxyl-kinase NOL9 [Hetaerina americana]|uniref:polynucleotide 5'-hydroxyl-kinase NOL9 n=1 Tax=Hetaerina americana TaxID=62018 RepID=UPI003A7F2B30